MRFNVEGLNFGNKYAVSTGTVQNNKYAVSTQTAQNM
jgi:hypothetical protein